MRTWPNVQAALGWYYAAAMGPKIPKPSYTPRVQESSPPDPMSFGRMTALVRSPKNCGGMGLKRGSALDDSVREWSQDSRRPGGSSPELRAFVKRLRRAMAENGMLEDRTVPRTIRVKSGCLARAADHFWAAWEPPSEES